jgi:hypothetical protein
MSQADSDQKFLELTAADLLAQRAALQRLREMVEIAEASPMRNRVMGSKSTLAREIQEKPSSQKRAV